MVNPEIGDPKMWGGWENVTNPNTGDLHTMPYMDIQPHRPSMTCPCDYEVNEDGVVMHTSHDGREAYETGQRRAH